MGGKCCLCDYNKCSRALSLHHLDPSKKDFIFASIRACPVNWATIVEELKKCILVCSNCHAEIHDGLIEVPKDVAFFNEEFSDYRKLEYEKSLTPCKICNKLKPKHLITCSSTCAAKRQRKIDWDTINLIEELKTKSFVKLAAELGCSDMAVRKRLKKLNGRRTRLSI